MAARKHLYILVLFCSLSSLGFAQWHQLPYPLGSNTYPNISYNPQFAVSSDQNIFLAWEIPSYTPFNITQFGVVHTNDDFATNESVFATGNQSPTPLILYAINDSTCEMGALSSIYYGNGNSSASFYAAYKLDEFTHVNEKIYIKKYVNYSGPLCTKIYLTDTITHMVQLKDSIPGNDWYSHMFFVNDSTGYVLGQYSGGSYFIKKTTNYAENWTDVLNTQHKVNNVYFPSAAIGYAVADSGFVYKTIDNGITWSEIQLPTQRNLYAVHFLNNNAGYVGGAYGALFKTIDGGISWNMEVSNDTQGIGMVKMVNDSTAYFSDYKNIYKNNYSNINSIKSPKEKGEIKIFPNPASNELNVLASTSGEIDVVIYDLNGNNVLSQKLTDDRKLNISELAEGVYTLLVKSAKQQSASKLVVLRN